MLSSWTTVCLYFLLQIVSSAVFWSLAIELLITLNKQGDRPCGLVTRVPGYGPRCPGLDSWRYQIFWVAVDLEQGPLSLMRINEEPLERMNRSSSLENRDWRPWWTASVTRNTLLSAKVGNKTRQPAAVA
jgi:hypothetical protein